MSRPYDLMCFSHLRWDYVTQRPNHLLSRCSRERRVFFVEEPLFDGGEPRLDVSVREHGLHVVVPRLPAGMRLAAAERAAAGLLSNLVEERVGPEYVCWYYTPMALGYARHLQPLITVYDCMDELSLFKGAPPRLREREEELFRCSSIVFTGGQSIYEAKRHQHHNVHCFPSSVDARHFGQARYSWPDPGDQAAIPRPRLGYFGVIDERIGLDLVRAVAELRPGWQLIFVGPVAKIDPATLPRLPNIHYLGQKHYTELPRYIAGWDVAILPFAHNDSTRFISPTKTPEYLAAGRPVVSTSIHDVVHPYEALQLVRIADTPRDFVAAVEAALLPDGGAHQARADEFLSTMSWDQTWAGMRRLMDAAVTANTRTRPPSVGASTRAA